MEISLAVPKDRQVVESYGDWQFKVSGHQFQGSVIVFPDRSEAWPISGFEELTAQSLMPVTASGQIEVLLVGCGTRMQMITPELRGEMRKHGVSIEPMDTGAACRTYNVLLAEGRAVAAALIAIE
ncbi:Mth938-like domain-containing protein [Pelagibius sp. Alg239-R121]|uniref:Mth938-like domain-containing protein n=1 Tax=Pelagibius sp. Alg239-R121 TaxID=2993448 RepID=UPI0024A660F9|nr:Mth938-like domain-containing protein [Pelagibius sp. Alg239-R121]